ncbi:hypothetical protein BC936DRAFT_138712 [Jimgerdemannia flammicorona]|uniref:SP-RING-type domain-containing protein n=1 Tax=Jimgerdemannia flammicorona TaxID=994334 RepID=A0A433BQM2_9FUNG|nr:hypothetical protein BC936DRAFT_138712 [Jimgerdemannia flammicorona]
MAPIASSSRAPPPPIEHSPGPDPLSEAEVDEDPFENFHIEPACAVKLNNLVGDFDKVLDSITHGMQRGTETACELEEVQEPEQVEKIEFSIRTYIDLENRLKIEKAAMENLRDRIKGGEKIKNLVAEYQTAVQRATDEYENQPEAAKYFGNEAFVDFKQKVWEVHHPDQEMPPLNPRPVDDDLVIGTQRVSLKCPITQTLLVNPVTRCVRWTYGVVP